jgi:nitroreductase
MDMYRGIISKRDRRAYLDRPLPDEVVRRILQAGRMTGSSKNSEPNRFVLVRDREMLRTLSETSPVAGFIEGCAALVVLVQVREHPFDAGRCAQNMMLAAWNEGVTSCPAHLPEAKLAGLLGIPGDLFINRVIAFGYPDPERTGVHPSVVRKRLPLEELVHEERWQRRD